VIRAEVRFKNSSFMKALERSEYRSIAEFSRASGISYSYLVEYANLRHSFKSLKDQVKIAQLLDCELYELFDQYDKVIEKNKGTVRKIVKEIPVEKMLSFESKELRMLESDYNTDDLDHEIGIKKEVNDAINTLKDREKDVIKLHFGIGVREPMALSDIAKEFGLSLERTRQIKEKALRRLKHESRSKKLQPYAMISPLAKKEAREELKKREFKSWYGYSQKYTRLLEKEKRKRKES
jgi:RNA polymerase primary sigma factor